MPPRCINVAVVHDNFLTRAGLATTFAAREDMTVRAMALDDIGLLLCDVVVADLRCGMEILSVMSRQPPGAQRPRVAIVAGSDGEWQIRDALEQGAAGYMLLGSTGDELISAVRTVHEGGCHLGRAISTKLAEILTAERLTAREEQVMVLVADGLCYKRIAARLNISVGTVKTHLRSTFDKLHVGSRTAAVATAQRRGILRHAKLSSEAQMPRPWLYDRGLPCGAEANSAKYLAAEACYGACESAMFTHGGMGYAKEYHVERYLREAWIPRLAPVSPQLILCFIAEKVLGLPKSY